MARKGFEKAIAVVMAIVVLMLLAVAVVTIANNNINQADTGIGEQQQSAFGKIGDAIDGLCTCPDGNAPVDGLCSDGSTC